MREDVDIAENEDDVVEIQGSAKKPHTLGPMDQFSRPIDPMESTVELRKKSRQQNINDARFRLDEVISSLKLKWTMILYLMNLMGRYSEILDDCTVTILQKFLD